MAAEALTALIAVAAAVVVGAAVVAVVRKRV